MQDLKARPADPVEDALLVPTGTPLYESLTTKFVAFDRMLAALSESSYSGYVRLSAPGMSAIMLLRSGRVVDTLSREHGELTQGEGALRAVERLVGRGEGLLDIVGLEPELVDGLHHLAAGTETYPDLVASWVHINGLVEFLEKRDFTGSLTVQAAADSGVILFVGGTVTGAFNQAARSVSTSPDDVCALCQDPEARISVRAAAAPAAEPAETRFRTSFAEEPPDARWAAREEDDEATKDEPSEFEAATSTQDR